MKSRIDQLATETIKNLDPVKYSGKWYEIGRKPLVWEKDCVSATAEYDWDQSNNRLRVKNTCYHSDGTTYSRYGDARITDKSNTGKLIVSFDEFRSSSYYLVLWTDYKHSIVSDNTGEYLWILSRTPQICLKKLQSLLGVVHQFIQDTSNFKLNQNTCYDCGYYY